MKKRRLTAVSFMFVAVVLFVSCDDLFPPDDFEPSGNPFNLNASIRVSSITGSLRHFSNYGQFAMDMQARSTSGEQESDNLPAGLLFVSTRNRVQHMVLLKAHDISVDTLSTLLVIGTFCCNERREIPDDLDSFDIGPVTDDNGLRELADLVRDKDISQSLGMVQSAVWLVTDSTGLTQAYRDSIDALPGESFEWSGNHR